MIQSLPLDVALIKWVWQRVHCDRAMEVFTIESCMQGSEGTMLLKDFWSPIVDESFLCELEEDNAHDRYTVMICKNGRLNNYYWQIFILALFHWSANPPI